MSSKRRARGDGAVFRRCESTRGCPPREEVTHPDGTTAMVRPEHNCRGYWIARLELADGTRAQRAATTKTRALARLEELKREVGEYGATAKSITCDEWFGYWLDAVKTDLRPKTAKQYQGIWRSHVAPVIGDRQVRKIAADPRPLRKVLTSGSLASLGSTRRQAYIMLNGLFADARREGYATRNPMEVIRKPTPRSGERKGPTTAECRTLLSHVARSGDRLASRWVAVFFTLQRQGECLGLEWDRVDWDRDLIDVSWQLDDLPYRHGCAERASTDGRSPCGRKHAGRCPEREYDIHPDYEHRPVYGALSLVVPKSERGKRVIPMLPTLRAVLARRRELYEAERGDYTTDHGLVWCRPDGRPLTAQADTRAWHDVCEDAGIGRYDLHGGRHSGGTLLLEAGVPDPIVQALMGHSSARVSHGYQHADTTLMRAAMMDAIERPLAIGG